MKKKGVLILNLGTPNSPSVKDVRVYLREFLNDPRVIDIGKNHLMIILEFDIMYGEGISKIGEIIDLGVEMNIINKSR